MSVVFVQHPDVHERDDDVRAQVVGVLPHDIITPHVVGHGVVREVDRINIWYPHANWKLTKPTHDAIVAEDTDLFDTRILLLARNHLPARPAPLVDWRASSPISRRTTFDPKGGCRELHLLDGRRGLLQRSGRCSLLGARASRSPDRPRQVCNLDRTSLLVRTH